MLWLGVVHELLWLVIAGTPSHGANSYATGHDDCIQRREGGGEEGREGGHAKDNIHRLTKLHLSLEFADMRAGS